MEIPGYKYIAHKIVPRPWGVECRFAVRKGDQPDINDIVMLSDGKEDEKELVELILGRLALVDIVREPDPTPERTFTEKEVESLLVEKGYLVERQKIEALKQAVIVKEIVK